MSPVQPTSLEVSDAPSSGANHEEYIFSLTSKREKREKTLGRWEASFNACTEKHCRYLITLTFAYHASQRCLPVFLPIFTSGERRMRGVRLKLERDKLENYENLFTFRMRQKGGGLLALQIVEKNQIRSLGEWACLQTYWPRGKALRRTEHFKNKLLWS